jgi:hypothetical protein
MSKIIFAFACATFLSLPALAAAPPSVTERATNGEITAPRILVEDTKVQQPRVRVAPGCGTSCGFFGG